MKTLPISNCGQKFAMLFSLTAHFLGVCPPALPSAASSPPASSTVHCIFSTGFMVPSTHYASLRASIARSEVAFIDDKSTLEKSLRISESSIEVINAANSIKGPKVLIGVVHLRFLTDDSNHLLLIFK